MNSVSRRSISVRIFVKDFDHSTMEYKYMRPERVAFPPKGIFPRKAYLWRTGESVDLYVFLMDWKEYTVVPIFMASNQSIAKCLDRLRINCYEFVL